MSPAPVVWIAATGTEILQGHSTDRNSPRLSGRLIELGLPTARHLTLPDDFDRLRGAFEAAAREADLLIVTGGLGPTEDDVNREAIAAAYGCELYEDAQALAGIEELLRSRGRAVLPANRCQAMIPRGSRLMANFKGTAPGFFIPPDPAAGRGAVMALPGPPRENEPMFEGPGIELIREFFGEHFKPRRVLTLHTTGLPEAQINERIRDLFARDPQVGVALLFSPGTVVIRVTFEGEGDALESKIVEWRELIQERLGEENIFGEDDDTLPAIVGRLLRDRGQTIAIAESCTAGLLAARLAEAPGCSDYFVEGFVTYANEAKSARLGVDPESIKRHGAVSAQVAEAMALRARKVAWTDWAISVTGISGPDGGTKEKPVGLVWFGLARPDGQSALLRHQFIGDRNEIRERAAMAGLDILRRALIGVRLSPQLPDLFSATQH